MNLNFKSAKSAIVQNKITSSVIAIAVIILAVGIYKYDDYRKTENCKSLYETYKEVGKTLDSVAPFGESYLQRAVRKCHDEYRL